MKKNDSVLQLVRARLWWVSLPIASRSKADSIKVSSSSVATQLPTVTETFAVARVSKVFRSELPKYQTAEAVDADVLLGVIRRPPR